MTGAPAWAGRGIALWLIGLCLILAGALAPTGARAQALFPGGCPVVLDAFVGATVNYSFSAGSSGTFTDAGGTVCRGIGQPGVWRYRYSYTVTSTLADATFRITSPHEGGVDITAPGTYEVVSVYPDDPAFDYWPAHAYGLSFDEGRESYDEDVHGPLRSPALGLGYSTTATGPNPSGTVTVSFTAETADVPGSRVTFTTMPAPAPPAFVNNEGFFFSGPGDGLRQGERPNIVPLNFGVGFHATRYLLQTGATYGFTVNPYAAGLLHSVTCSAGSATVGADNASFTLTGQADRSQVNCTLAHAQRPTVTGLSPATGPAAGGTVVTLTGTNFTGVTAVRFGATAATAFTVNSATQITATAPAGAGTANVSVVIGSLTSTDTAADDFAYLPAPTVTGLSPTSGARTGGTSVVVTGTNLTGATGVTFGGVAATAFTVNSATQITATAPAGAVNGPVDVRVTAPGGLSANTAADDFTYTGPVVQGLFQAGCPDVYGSTTTTYSFAAGASGAFADAGGTTCRARRQPPTFRYNYTYTVTSTLVDATFSINGVHGTTTNITGPGTYTISPRLTGGEIQRDDQIRYGSPVNTSLDEDLFADRLTEPPLGVSYATTATGPDPSGTVTVTITDGVIDVPGTVITFNDPVTLNVLYTTGSGLVRVRGDLFIRPEVRAENAFLYVLEPGIAYTFNQTAHVSGRRLSAITCTGATPTLDAANNRFTLAALPDRGTASCDLTHSFAPVISSVAPATGPAAGGTVVTITGDAFTNVTAVRFGGVAATAFTINSATQITATAPAGTGVVGVSALIGALPSTDTSADDYTYVSAQPTVTALSPTTGPLAGGTAVTITGTNLTGATAVRFAGVAATAFMVNSATQITATAPAGAAGVADVIVTAGGQDSANTAADNYTYAATTPPVVEPPVVETPPSPPPPTPPPPPPSPTVGSITVAVAFNASGQTIGLSPGGVFDTVAIVQGPAGGSVTLSGTTATYTPRPGFFGTDSFTYIATGPGGASAPATVSITVAMPSAPVIVVPPPLVQPPSTPGGAFSLDLGSTADGVIQGFRLTAQPSGGDVSIEEEPVSAGGSADKSDAGPQATTARRFRLVYRPRANFIGQDRVTLVGFGPGGTSAPATFIFNVTGKAPDLDGRSASNAMVRLRPTAALTGGPFQAIRVTQPPAFGSVAVQGLELVFTPALTDSGSTSFAYVIDLPFGTSAAGTARVVTDLAPLPAPLSATTEAGRPVTVELTTGARGGPFTGAAVVSVTPAGAGTASVAEAGASGARTYALTFTPTGQFAGDAVVAFTLSNAAATGAGTLRMTVTPRPDPTADPEVRGVISSQVDSARRFADAQVGNFGRRLQDIRDGTNDSRSDLSLNFGFARSLGGGRPVGPFDGLTGNRFGGDVDEGLDDRDTMGMSINRDREARMPDARRVNAAPPPSQDAGSSEPNRIGVWATGAVEWGRRDGLTGARDFRITTQGVTAGMDLRVTPDLILGVGAGYGRDRTEIGDQASRSETTGATGALYGGWRPAPGLFIDGVAGHTRLAFETRRRISTGGGLAEGERDGGVTFGSLSAGMDRRSGTYDWSLYGRLDHQSFDLDGFTETGGGSRALRFDALSFDRLSGSLGLRGGLRIVRREGVLTPRARLEWRHAFDDFDPQGVRYADWAESPVYGLPFGGLESDLWSFGLDIGWAGASGYAIDLGYRGEAGASSLIQGFDVRMRQLF